LKHFATPEFWFHFRQLPAPIQDLAKKNFELMKLDPRHPSIRLKKVDNLWSARVGLNYRALAHEHSEGLMWWWVGSHESYDKLT
jgi:hypothetical protein